MRTQFTPGPWTLRANGDANSYSIDHGNHWVVYQCNGQPTPEENEANMRLMTAAPEMLHLLDVIYANAAESVEWIRERIAPIIAKARGEA